MLSLRERVGLLVCVFVLCCCVSDGQVMTKTLVVVVTSPADEATVANDAPLSLRLILAPLDEISNITVACMCGQEHQRPLDVSTVYPPFAISKQKANEHEVEIGALALDNCRGDVLTVDVTGHYTTTVDTASDRVRLFVSNIEMSIRYLSASFVSLFASICMFVVYANDKRFPNNLVMWRAVCDVLFCLQNIYVSGTEVFANDRSHVCNPVVAFAAQFSMFGSLGWFIAMLFNLYVSISNPFRRPQSYMFRYHSLVWVFALITGLITTSTYGFRQDYQICWVKHTHALTVWPWLLYWVWLLLALIGSVVVVVYAWMKLTSHKLQTTLETRMDTLRRIGLYVSSSLVYWIVATSLWFRTFDQGEHGGPATDEGVSNFFAVWVSLGGLFSVFPWLLMTYVQTRRRKRRRRRAQRTSTLLGHGYYETVDGDDDSEFSVSLSLAQFESEQSGGTSDSHVGIGNKNMNKGRYLPPNVVREPSSKPPDLTGGDGSHDISAALRLEFIQNTSIGIQKSIEASSRLNGAGGGGDADGDVMKWGGSRDSVINDDVLLSSYQRNHMDQSQLPVLPSSPPGSETVFSQCSNFNLPSGVLFRAYAPLVFQELRSIFGVSTAQFTESMKGEASAMKKSFSEGKSGSFFYFTTDTRYMVKTVEQGEFQFFLSILPAYAAYMKRFPNSLISRFFGVYSVEMYGVEVFFAVMNNILHLPTDASYFITEKYDLKGSVINRHASRNKKKLPTFKDLDLNYCVRLDPAVQTRVKFQLTSDCRFLESLGIMDYSLLLGVGHVEAKFVPDTENFASLLSPSTTNEQGTAGTTATGTNNNSGSVGKGTMVAMPSIGEEEEDDDDDDEQEEKEQCGDEIKSNTNEDDGTGLVMPAVAVAADNDDDGLEGEAKQNAAVVDSSYRYLNIQRDRSGERHRDRHLSNDGAWPANRLGVGVANIIVGPGVFHLGLIDVLQEWDFKKKMEHWFKRIFFCRCRTWSGMSAVDPYLYADRFLEMLENVIPTRPPTIPQLSERYPATRMSVVVANQ